MTTLFYKLHYGVDKKDVTKKEQVVVDELVELNLVYEKNAVFRFKGDLIVGTFESTSKIDRNSPSYITLLVKDVMKKDPIVFQEDQHNAKDGDMVIAVFKSTFRGRIKAKIVYVLEKDGNTSICYLSNKNDNYKILDLFTQKEIKTSSKQKSLKTLPKDCVMVVETKNNEIIEILGTLNEPLVDELIVLRYFDRFEEFSKESLKEVESFGDEVYKELYSSRVDLTDFDFVTIDPKTAKDYDDAIYYDEKNTTLYVAIADVSAYVNQFSKLDKEARERGFSIYFPHKSIPMLPRGLSENLCSLVEGKDRLTFTFKIKLNLSTFEVDNFELFESVINSKKRYCYEEIDELFEDQSIEDNNRYFLDPLKDIITKVREKRLKNGYTFINPDVRVVLDKNLEFQETQKEVDSFSHHLIEDCMLLANKSAATYFKYGIFRVHEEPDRSKIEDMFFNLSFLGFNESPGELHKKILSYQEQSEKKDLREQVDRMIIKSMKRAQYSFENRGHFGLGFDRYTHFTSPIRRYADLILHRLLKAIISNDEKMIKYITNQMQIDTNIINDCETATTKAQWMYDDRIFARWAAKNIGTTLNGYVEDTGTRDKDIIIKSEEIIIGARIFVPYTKKCDPNKFDKVEVKITKSLITTAKIYGEIVL